MLQNATIYIYNYIYIDATIEKTLDYYIYYYINTAIAANLDHVTTRAPVAQGKDTWRRPSVCENGVSWRSEIVTKRMGVEKPKMWWEFDDNQFYLILTYLILSYLSTYLSICLSIYPYEDIYARNDTV